MDGGLRGWPDRSAVYIFSVNTIGLWRVGGPDLLGKHFIGPVLLDPDSAIMTQTSFLNHGCFLGPLAERSRRKVVDQNKVLGINEKNMVKDINFKVAQSQISKLIKTLVLYTGWLNEAALMAHYSFIYVFFFKFTLFSICHIETRCITCIQNKEAVFKVEQWNREVKNQVCKTSNNIR